MPKHRDRRHDAVQEAKACRPDRVAFGDVLWASNLLTGPQGPLSNALLHKTSPKAIKTIAVYEFMT